jgi:hypothetical protein
MHGNFLRIISLAFACVAAIVSSASSADRPAVQELRGETWALMIPLPSSPTLCDQSAEVHILFSS